MSLAARIGEFRSLSPEQLAARVNRSLPFWASLLLVAVIAWQLSALTWSLLPSPQPDISPLPALGASSGGPAGGADLQRDLQAVIQAHLFGKAEERKDAPPPVVAEAPETTLSLTLQGTLAAERGEESLAIISERGGETKVYAVGDAIRSGTTLHSVYADRVLLERSGRLEKLLLPKELGEDGLKSLQPRGEPQASSAAGRTSVRELINQNVATLTEVIRPQPVFANGQQRGYRVYPGRQRQAFAALGLRPGDLITEINGTALDDPTKGMEIFRSLGDATSVTVTVERDGQPEVLVLDTSQLGEE
jgi:general secretion pathway protein C